MNIDRRQFNTLAAGLLSWPTVVAASNKNTGKPLFLSAASDGDDRHWVIGFSTETGITKQVFKHQLPARAHHIAVHEALGVYLVIARRPGRYLWAGDLATGKHLNTINVPDDRHLYGHGVFTNNGKNFYTTENAWKLINGDSGRVVTWQADRRGDTFTLERLEEYPSYGTGPHELLLKPDQQTLVVANGGIRTHPDRGREKLNITSMQPSLVYMDAGTGDLQDQYVLKADYHKASIRHLDQNASGLIAIAMQYQGEAFDRAPLLALHQQGKEGKGMRTLWAPEPVQGQMSQYVGSVRFDNSGRYIAASCPRGNMISFWDTNNDSLVGTVRSRDGCGVSAVDNGFLYTAGTGRIVWYDLATDQVVDMGSSLEDKVFWDNHLSILSV
ncbi:MAG: DUF1513 domain-containing protein [Gammaproteobacteria bacterium]|nr:DUF1513 domain-containing protein [Gammaproteobacteria bacterium]